jgi:hypothetical protein
MAMEAVSCYTHRLPFLCEGFGKAVAMAKFQLIGGDHVDEAGNSYAKGAIIESPHDLTRTFRLKFRRVSDVTPVSKKGPKVVNMVSNLAPPEAVAEVVEAEKEEPGENPPMAPTPSIPASLGIDVTDQFSTAKEQDYKVYKRTGKYFVYDADDLTKAFNPDGSKKTDVDGVIATALGK